ncbi:MAG: hypothetical protein H0U00_03810 [Actinobacteria bacterium]|nr:hypothetical protein [Actinomycetota bacterium]
MSPLPQEAERLLSVEPNRFVAERDQLVRTLRSEDRRIEADTVAALRKPTVVVYAVNRAARDRPKAAVGAADAARKVKEAQIGGASESFRNASTELDEALDLLAEVAVAHVAPRGKTPSDAMRRRVRELLRTAVSDDDARESLARGTLTEELEAVGFSSYAGMAPTPPREERKHSGPSRAEQQEARRREHEHALKQELAKAERRLQDAAQAVRKAERESKAAERAVASIRTKIDRAG